MVPYNPLPETESIDRGYISICAKRKIIKVFKKKLKKIARFIVSISDIKVKVFVDTAPLMEKPLKKHLLNG